MNYGFINLNNDANEVPIKVFYNLDDKMKQVKQDMLKDTSDLSTTSMKESCRSSCHGFASWSMMKTLCFSYNTKLPHRMLLRNITEVRILTQMIMKTQVKVSRPRICHLSQSVTKRRSFRRFPISPEPKWQPMPQP